MYTQYYPDYPLKVTELQPKIFEAAFLDVLKKYNSVKTQNYAPILRMMCVGNDMHFNKFVNMYTRLWEYCKANEQSRYYNVQQLEIRVYLVPVGFNSLAQYLATYDDVYNQEIFIPFVRDPLIPKLDPNVAKKELSPEEAEKLGEFWASTEIQAARDRQVQMYLRDATRFLRIKVCKAELVKFSSAASGGERPETTETVYFVCRAEIGMHSAYAKSGGSLPLAGLPEMGSGPAGAHDPGSSGLPIKLKYCLSVLTHV